MEGKRKGGLKEFHRLDISRLIILLLLLLLLEMGPRFVGGGDRSKAWGTKGNNLLWNGVLNL